MMCSTMSKPVRLKIISYLNKGKLNVSELQKKLDVPMSNLSNHLNALYRAGIVGKDKQGNFVYYYVTVPDLVKGIGNMQKVFKQINDLRHKMG